MKTDRAIATEVLSTQLLILIFGVFPFFLIYYMTTWETGFPGIKEAVLLFQLIFGTASLYFLNLSVIKRKNYLWKGLLTAGTLLIFAGSAYYSVLVLPDDPDKATYYLFSAYTALTTFDYFLSAIIGKQYILKKRYENHKTDRTVFSETAVISLITSSLSGLYLASYNIVRMKLSEIAALLGIGIFAPPIFFMLSILLHCNFLIQTGHPKLKRILFCSASLIMLHSVYFAVIFKRNTTDLVAFILLSAGISLLDFYYVAKRKKEKKALSLTSRLTGETPQNN